MIFLIEPFDCLRYRLVNGFLGFIGRAPTTDDELPLTEKMVRMMFKGRTMTLWTEKRDFIEKDVPLRSIRKGVAKLLNGPILMGRIYK
jgi:hypothetical protein